MKFVLALIEERFQEKLQAKTGWGRNEVLAAYRQAVVEVLAEQLDEVMG